MALKDALKKLNEAVTDLSSLHVQTFTGRLQSDVDNQAGFDGVRQTVAQARTDGDITLVAEAYYQFDGDSYNFLTSEEVPASALALHQSAVEAGLATRRGLMELVKGVFD